MAPRALGRDASRSKRSAKGLGGAAALMAGPSVRAGCLFMEAVRMTEHQGRRLRRRRIDVRRFCPDLIEAHFWLGRSRLYTRRDGDPSSHRAPVMDV